MVVRADPAAALREALADRADVPVAGLREAVALREALVDRADVRVDRADLADRVVASTRRR